jgi:pyridoxal 5'-phosphate synthase pdxS subunit
MEKATVRVKTGFAEMFKGGVIMDVMNADQARIAEDAGATSVMALERIPADIRTQGGVSRMSDPDMIEKIKAAVSIPVMAKVRIGHFVEAQILEAIGVDFIDESEVLTPADERFHINKWDFKVPFVCGCTNIGEALRRVGEGASMVRTKGEAGTGNVVEAVRHARSVLGSIRQIQATPKEELMTIAKENGAPYDLVLYVHQHGKLPVVNFAAGGVATPADAALMMQLGVDGVFVGSGIFKSAPSLSEKEKPQAWFRRAQAIVKAVTHYNDPKMLAEVSRGLGEAMVGINLDTLMEEERLAKRGW